MASTISNLHLALLIAASPVVVPVAGSAEPASPAGPASPADKASRAATPASENESCPFNDKNPCVIELRGAKAPSVSPNCTAEPWSKLVSFTLPDRFADSNHDGWWETVMKIGLDVSKGCSGATFRVIYDQPQGSYSVNIGDSPTNNGFGGDAGTTFKAAEMMVNRGFVTVYTSPLEEGTATVETLFQMQLPALPRHCLELEVRDAFLGFAIPGASGASPLAWQLQTPFSGLLYDLSPSVSYDGSASSKRRADGIYAAFNRVIHDKNGAPSPPTRVGTGVRRVEVRLAP